MISYDKLSEYDQILLDLPFHEGMGLVTRDQAKPHHQDVVLNEPGGGSFLWDRIAFGRSAFDSAFARDGSDFDSGRASFGLGFSLDFPSPAGVGHLTFAPIGGGATDGVYLDCAAANCADLDFMAGDYSLGVWFRWETTGNSLIIIGRYEVDVSGWELYLWRAPGPIDYLTLRHHHAGTIVGANPRSACYSVGWTPEVWWFMGVSRTGGGEGVFYRNGGAIATVAGGLVDPETCPQDLVLGARYSKDSDWYKGQKWRPRAWPRILTAAEWLNIFEQERHFFGV